MVGYVCRNVGWWTTDLWFGLWRWCLVQHDRSQAQRYKADPLTLGVLETTEGSRRTNAGTFLVDGGTISPLVVRLPMTDEQAISKLQRLQGWGSIERSSRLLDVLTRVHAIAIAVRIPMVRNRNRLKCGQRQRLLIADAMLHAVRIASRGSSRRVMAVERFLSSIQSRPAAEKIGQPTLRSGGPEQTHWPQVRESRNG